MAKINLGAYGDMALLPVPSKAGFVESLMWVNDVITATDGDGSEERILTRSCPKQTFRSECQSTVALNQHLFNTVYGGLAEKWAIPVWSEGQYAGTLAIGATGAAVGAAAADLRAGTLALLYGRGGQYAAVLLTTVSDSAVTFPALASEIKNAYLFPMRYGIQVGQPTKKIGLLYPTWVINYESFDGIEFTPDAPTQFLGDDIYFTDNLLDGDTSSSKLSSGVMRVDGELGAVYASSPWTTNRITTPYSVITKTLEDAWAYRMWLHRRQGRYRPFWYPSFEHDVRPYNTGSNITTVLTVKDDQYDAWARSRTHLAIQKMDNSWLARTINSAVVVGSNVQLTLDTSLGGIPTSQIQTVAYLGLKRLDSDKVDLNWIGNEVMQSKLNLYEISP